MRRIVYQALLSAPFKFGGTAAAVGGAISSIWPDKVRAILDSGSFPVQAVGIAALCIGILYFAALWLLKPGEKPNAGRITQAAHGPHSPNFGTVQGDVHITNSTPAVTQPAKSPYGGWNEQSLEGLARIMSPEAVRSEYPPAVIAILKDVERRNEEAVRRASEPKPDLPLTGLLVHVYKSLGGAPNGVDNIEMAKFWKKVDLEVADKIAVERLHVWGRLSDAAIQPISDGEWQRGSFNHKTKTLRVPAPYADSYEYTDLRFNKREIERTWPLEQ